MKKLRLITLGFVLAALLTVLMPVNVGAIADPDSPPDIEYAGIFVDLLEEGDAGLFVNYNLDYTATPTETVDQTYLVVFVDTDGITQLKSTAPYPYNDKGYGRGSAWIYFTAAEVSAYGIDITNAALYRVWLTGNPLAAWAGDPPKTIAGLDYFMPSTASASALLGTQVLTQADTLETSWGGTTDLIEQSGGYNHLTTEGRQYFENVIPYLSDMAPNIFSDVTLSPSGNTGNLTYATSYNVTAYSYGGTIAGSPQSLDQGANNVNVTVGGTIQVVLYPGCVATAESDVGVVTGSPVHLTAGNNTITSTAGNIIITTEWAVPQGQADTARTGTAFDLTDLATQWGMSLNMTNALVWLLVTILICGIVYGVAPDGSRIPGISTSGKTILIIFDICIIGGAVLGMITILAAVLMFIAFGAFTGYILFYKPSGM